VTDFDDYQGDMRFSRRTDHDIEGLFDNPPVIPSDLTPVADLFTALRAESSTALDAGTHARFVHAASRTAAATTAPVSSAATMGRSSVVGSLRRRVAAVAVAAAVFAGGMTGMAVAADHAKPGDALYGLDRAFEAVGIGNGHAVERLAEAQSLVDAGEVDRGLRQAAEAVESQGSEYSAASLALMDAAERVVSVGSDRSQEVRVQVAGLLSYLSENRGAGNGRLVAELAREIGGPAERPETPSTAGRPESPGNSGSHRADPPGRSGHEPGTPNPPRGRP